MNYILRLLIYKLQKKKKKKTWNKFGSGTGHLVVSRFNEPKSAPSGFTHVNLSNKIYTHVEHVWFNDKLLVGVIFFKNK